ncbi:MAG: DNA alkylation repair protein, partial [Clostridia bacterium]|nr:DNA alkylation repair protein [Clostridia bacterium]
ITQFRDIHKVVDLVDKFRPYVDNWATCDSMSPKFFKKDYDLGYNFAVKCIKSDKEFVNRYGIDILMTCFLDDKFSPDHFELVLSAQNGEYYTKMMKAWYFATALAKQPTSAISVFESGLLDDWTHNKAIQKAIESFRIDDNMKGYLRSLKRK